MMKTLEGSEPFWKQGRSFQKESKMIPFGMHVFRGLINRSVSSNSNQQSIVNKTKRNIEAKAK